MTNFRRYLAVIFAGLAVSASAHWETHDHLPRYARRGVLRACVAPFTGERLQTWLDVDPMACDYNLIFTGQPGWEHEAVVTELVYHHYVKPRNGHLFMYTCPNSIYYNDEFERVDFREDIRFERHRWDTFNRFPYAKDQIVWGRDGKPLVAYAWPSSRHRTSYFSTRWLEHHFELMDYHVNGTDAIKNPLLKKWAKELDHTGITSGFYYDNTGLRQDWGPLAMAEWEKVSMEAFGEVVDPKTSTDLRVRMLWEDMQYKAFIRYNDALRQHAWSIGEGKLSMQPTKGAPAYYAEGLDYPDIEFYENSGKMLPQSDNIWDVKGGLARTHGKAQAVLTHDHFPRPRLDRGGDFVVLNWKLNEQYTRLMMAEALAMNAAHMVQIGPMTYDTMRFNSEVAQYNTFNRELEEEVYREALPGAKLAILLPLMSEAHGSASNDPLGERLWRSGWPYEVVMEHDLTKDVWPGMDMDVIILPDVRCLNEERVAVLLDWVRAGGKALVSQALATRDELGMPRSSELGPQLLGNIPIRMSYSAAYDCQLTGFTPEKQGRVWLPMNFHEGEKTPEGTISLTFNGAEGDYDVRVIYLDENDGVGKMSVSQNGETISQFDLDIDDNDRHVHKLRSVRVKNGDTFEVKAIMDMAGEEFCRVYDIEFVPVGADLETVSYRQVGKGLVAYAPQNLMRYSAEDLTNMLVRLGDGRLARVDYSPGPRDLGAIFVNMMRDHANRATQVHLVNATYSTPERYATITSTDQQVQAKIKMGDVPTKPVLRFMAFGVGDGWQFVANVNGKDLPPVEGEGIRNTAWVSIPMDPTDLTANAENVVTIRGAGRVDAYGSHVAIYLDMDQTSPASSYSEDGGQTWSSADLSALNGVQTGAYMIQIDDATARPPALEMRTHLVPRRDVRVQLDAATVPAGAQVLMISPDQKSRRLRLDRQGGRYTVTVPELDVYNVLLVSNDTAYLDSVEAKVRNLAFQPLLPRTAEFKELLREGAVGERLPGGELEGDYRLRGVDQIDPATVGARNSDRYFAKDLKPGEDFEVFPDGRLEGKPGMPAVGGSIFLTWTDIPGGHYRDEYKPYIRESETIMLPPGWRRAGYQPDESTVARADQPGEYRDGEAAVRIIGPARNGIYTGSDWLDLGRPYAATVWVKVLSGQAQVIVVNGDGQTLTQTCEPGDWQRVELRFVAQANKTAIRILAADTKGPSEFLVDAASIQELPE